MLDREEIINLIKEIIESETYLKKNNDGMYTGEIYADYREKLSDESIEKILDSENPMETFYDQFETIDCEDAEYNEVLKEIENNWNEEEFGDYNIYEDTITDWVHENVNFNFPYDHYLKQDINVDIIIDTGDGNYDFTLNNFLSYNARKDEEIQEESSILWLVKQQGYTKEDLINKNFKGSKFLESIYEECINVTTHMNALAFFVKITLGDAIAFKESKANFEIDKNTNCGLYDCWNGAGSLLNIQLEKPVIIPKEYISSMDIDGGRGYGIKEIYGMTNSFWN